jgi:hypothetical protein
VGKRLCDKRLYLKFSKCEFNAKRIGFVGFIVTPEGVDIEPDHTKAITEWPMPASYCDIEVFLDFAKFYS